MAAELAAQPDPPAVVLVSSRSRSDYGTRVGDRSALGFTAKSDISGDDVRLLLAGAS